ncbi:SAM dependent carboxyl methyltransferase, partial [Corchorus capsularis]
VALTNRRRLTASHSPATSGLLLPPFQACSQSIFSSEGNGYFSIEKIQELNKYFSTMGTTTMDMQSFITSNVRAVVEGVMNEHFGHKIVDELFRSFPKKLDNCNFIFDDEFCKDVDLFIWLKRKAPI